MPNYASSAPPPLGGALSAPSTTPPRRGAAISVRLRRRRRRGLHLLDLHLLVARHLVRLRAAERRDHVTAVVQRPLASPGERRDGPGARAALVFLARERLAPALRRVILSLGRFTEAIRSSSSLYYVNRTHM